MVTEVKKHFTNIDLIKVIAIYSVILIHNFYATANFVLNPGMETLINFAIRLFIEGVPIFIAINGYLIINKNFDLKKHLLKCLKVFILIIIWSVILIVSTAMIDKSEVSFKIILSNIFLTNINNKYTGILWFLQDLLTLYFFFPILKSLHDKDKKIYNYLFILVMITTIGFNLIVNLSKIVCSYLGMKQLPGMISKFLSIYIPLNKTYYVLYFMLGGYLFEYREKIKNYLDKKKIMLIFILNTTIAILVPYIISINTNKYVGGNFNYQTIFLFIYIILLFVISESYKDKNNIINKMIKSIAQNSLGIYFIHIIITRLLAGYVQFKSVGLSMILSMIVLLLSWSTTLIIKKIPYVKKIIEL